VPARQAAVGVTSMQFPPGPAPAGITTDAAAPVTVNVAFVFRRLVAPATLQIFSVEALFVNVAMVAFDASPGGTTNVPVAPARLLETRRFAGNAVIEATDVAGEPVSVTVTLPAGSVIGELHAPTGTVVVVAKFIGAAIENEKLPVRPEPVTAFLQTSITPVTRMFVNVTVTVPETSADAGTFSVAVPPVRLEEVRAVVGSDEMALTDENVDAVSATVVDPAGTAIGAVQSPVPMETGVAPPLIVNENGPVTAGVPARLQISMNPVVTSATAAPVAVTVFLAVEVFPAVADVLAKDGTASSSPPTIAARSTSRLFM